MRLNPEALRALRERTGYSIRQLATASGVSKTAISAAERGERNLGPSSIKALADTLQVPVVALIGLEEAS